MPDPFVTLAFFCFGVAIFLFGVGFGMKKTREQFEEHFRRMERRGR